MTSQWNDAGRYPPLGSIVSAGWRGATVALGILWLGPLLLAAERRDQLPHTFRECSVPLQLPGRPADAPVDGAAWNLAYDLAQAAGWEIALPLAALPAERFDVWLKPDGSGNVLRVEAWYAPQATWLHQADIVLADDAWQHLVIPAGNPLQAFHPEVPRLRLTVVAGAAAKLAVGRIALRDPRLVRTEPVAVPLPLTLPPAPAFDTWGGPGPSQIARVADTGVTMHMLPIEFPDGRPVTERVRYAAQAIPQVKEAGLVVGLAFNPTPSADWLAAHRALLCRGPEEVYDRPGGAFLSPWNPTAEQLFCDHIRDTLRQLERQGLLADVEVIELCPGEEGEISFEWHQVWAFDPAALAAYRVFLQKHYEDDIDAVNQDWGTAYPSFAEIEPPRDYWPDREHWVFTEFYRSSMLRRCVTLADAVEDVFRPNFWLWLPHAIGNARQRFFSARYPAYYVENLRRLGCGDYMHVAVLDWQTPEDVRQLRGYGARIIGEVDVAPSRERIDWTFRQAVRFGCDGVFLGVVERLADEQTETLTATGRLVRELTETFRHQWQPDVE